MPSGSPRNVWSGVIGNVERHGDLVRLDVIGPPDMVVDVTPDAVAELDLAVAERVWLSVKATDLATYDASV
jgi:molybdate transport system ATP-binding protein